MTERERKRERKRGSKRDRERERPNKEKLLPKFFVGPGPLSHGTMPEKVNIGEKKNSLHTFIFSIETFCFSFFQPLSLFLLFLSPF